MLEKNAPLAKLNFPDNTLYRIHSIQVLNNSPIANERVNRNLISPFFFVKDAAVETKDKCGWMPEGKHSLTLKPEEKNKYLGEIFIKKHSFKENYLT